MGVSPDDVSVVCDEQWGEVIGVIHHELFDLLDGGWVGCLHM